MNDMDLYCDPQTCPLFTSTKYKYQIDPYQNFIEKNPYLSSSLVHGSNIKCLDPLSIYSNQIKMPTKIEKKSYYLENMYEEIMQNFGKIELEASAYRLSAACKKNTLNKYTNLLVNTISAPKCFNCLHSNCECSNQLNGNTNNMNSQSQSHQPKVYKLNTLLIGPNSLFLNHVSNHTNLKWIQSRFGNFGEICKRLSCKIFLGGVPIFGNQVTLITLDQLQRALSVFGSVNLVWPKGVTVQSNGIFNETDLKRGYCYGIFKDSVSVLLLLTACQRRAKGNYIDLSVVCPELIDAKLNSIQVIPWDRQDSFFQSPTQMLVNSNVKTQTLDTRQTMIINEIKSSKSHYSIFVGALHGMITARALYNICNDLFGNVNNVTLDTDRYHYPIGSGRVIFSSAHSYVEAVKTNFVSIECNFFTKFIQIDPYLVDAICSKCVSNEGIYFCRHWNCFTYYCPKCWVRCHSSDTSHKPLRRSLHLNRRV